MTTAVFDTLKASRNLKAAGIDEAHAEAIVVMGKCLLLFPETTSMSDSVSMFCLWVMNT